MTSVVNESHCDISSEEGVVVNSMSTRKRLNKGWVGETGHISSGGYGGGRRVVPYNTCETSKMTCGVYMGIGLLGSAGT